MYWSYIGAWVQQRNADQLVNALLLDNAEVFRDAVFPVNHTFLIKWPVFLLEKLLGLGDSAYIVVTIMVVLTTIGSLVYLLYRIEKRPIVLGTIYLALASILMLVPVESAPGSLLPVNMAMAATRNLEYIVYIAALVCILQSKSSTSRRFIAGAIILALLIASDRLFLTLSVGGAVLGIIPTILFRRREQRSEMVRWLLGSLLGAVVASMIIWVLQRVTHISDSSGAGPYQFVQSVHDIVVGLAYGMLHIATNLGANPASQEPVLINMPSSLLQGMLSVSGVSYLVNLGLLAAVLWSAAIIAKTYMAKRSSDESIRTATTLSFVLLLSGIAAIGGFVGTVHYYAGDARYLAVVFFGLVVAGVTYLRQKSWKPEPLIFAGALCLLSVICAIPAVRTQADSSIAAHADTVSRNQRIGATASTLRQTLGNEPLVLVGDYWRVIPISQQDQALRVMPLESCLQPREVLSSKSWGYDLRDTKFLYILSLDASLTNYQRCSYEQVTTLLGQPYDVEVVAGTKKNPEELLLYYDKAAASLL